MKKTDARKLNTEAQQAIRHQAIRLKKAGRTYKEIGEIIGVQPTTVSAMPIRQNRRRERETTR